MGGQWFGEHKPVMRTFLKPFQEALSRLEIKGISCIWYLKLISTGGIINNYWMRFLWYPDIQLLRCYFLNGWVNFSCCWNQAVIRCFIVYIVILVLNSFSKQATVFWFFALEYEVGERNNLPLSTVYIKIAAMFLFFSTASSFTERISSSETEAKREAILFFCCCSEVNSTWLITSKLANQCARKVLFTCAVYANNNNDDDN